ncbi:hypothetical protein [Sphingopyxis sp. RIFCSPHIGHO2_12_FULL_65_19]|uniref:hypothetical protein n=1 Tax=Sphingopyxis sp. RIFCSPHIGHO2_12_FULL_65_19 TaxID=1802172 RepID=UPI0025FDB513|nr:hypothetical protein [Sphingopyxis sp. RIFCSPHIGHO2_12_FULL_65_19]
MAERTKSSPDDNQLRAQHHAPEAHDFNTWADQPQPYPRALYSLKENASETESFTGHLPAQYM